MLEKQCGLTALHIKLEPNYFTVRLKGVNNLFTTSVRARIKQLRSYNGAV